MWTVIINQGQFLKIPVTDTHHETLHSAGIPHVRTVVLSMQQIGLIYKQLG